MGSSTAGKWIIILTLYFFVFIVVMTYASNLDSNISYSGDDLVTTGENDYCDYPRYFYNSQFELIRQPYATSTKCEYTLGTISQQTCEAISGCSWDNVTSGFLWWTTTVETCTGNINTSYYNAGTSTNDICSMSGLQGRENNSKCGLIGCTYYTEKDNFNADNYDTSITSAIKPVNTFFSVTSDLLLFDADIGLPSGYNYLFTFLFFYIPLLAMVLSIALYIRG